MSNGKTKEATNEVFDPFAAWVGGLEAFCTPDRLRASSSGDATLSSGGGGREDRADNEAE